MDHAALADVVSAVVLNLINRPTVRLFCQQNTSYATVAGKSANKPVIKPQFKAIVGRSRTVQNSSNSQAGHISAAKPFISKATFCVDNVITSATLESMTQFININICSIELK